MKRYSYISPKKPPRPKTQTVFVVNPTGGSSTPPSPPEPQQELSGVVLGQTYDAAGVVTGTVIRDILIDEVAGTNTETVNWYAVGTTAAVPYNQAAHGNWGAVRQDALNATKTLESGQDTPIPAGMRSVSIKAITGVVSVSTGGSTYPLETGEVLDWDDEDGFDLPAIPISGGSWKWTATKIV